MSDTANGATIVAQGSGKSVSVFGVQVDILLTAQETGGVYSAYELGMEPGIGSPFHRHLQDEESFYVLEGTFEFICGERVETATTGAIIYLPRNIPHQFRNIGTGRGRLLGVGDTGGA